MAENVEFNDAFFEQLGRSPAVVAQCVAKANQVASTARASAPVDTEDYKKGIRVEVQSRGRRDAAVVVASDWKSLLVESKTGNLARALKAVGRG